MKCQSMRFTEQLMNCPSESRLELFEKLLTKLISLQKQLDTSITSIDFFDVGL